MSAPPMDADEQNAAACEDALGYRFTDRSLLQLALTHSSLKDEWTASNERIEFLGDSVLGLAVAEHLFCALPDVPEGVLTRIRSQVVSRDALTDLARQLKLRRFLRVGKGIRKTRTLPPSLLANAVEAVIGAIYLDAGFEVARTHVLDWLGPVLEDAASGQKIKNHKAALQQVTQRMFGCTPTYEVVEACGPDHDKEFVIQVAIKTRTFPAGRGPNKKNAEQRAARIALRDLKREHGSGFPTIPIA